MCDEDWGGGNVEGWGRKIKTLWQLLGNRFCSIWWCLIVVAHEVFAICKRKGEVKIRHKVRKMYGISVELMEERKLKYIVYKYESPKIYI